MFSQLSRWEGVQFYLLDNLLGWGEEKNLKKKKKTLFVAYSFLPLIITE